MGWGGWEGGLTLLSSCLQTDRCVDGVMTGSAAPSENICLTSAFTLRSLSSGGHVVSLLYCRGVRDVWGGAELFAMGGGRKSGQMNVIF